MRGINDHTILAKSTENKQFYWTVKKKKKRSKPTEDGIEIVAGTF